MRYAVSLLLTLCCLAANAFIVKGTVKDASGNPLPYANMYIKGTTNGTSANSKGEYQIELSAGRYDLVFQYIGFKTLNYLVDISADKTIDVVLEVSQYEMPSVVVNGSEDPAYAVIRKAIAQCH